MSPLSELLTETRVRSGLRQFELAEIVGYDQTYISSLETGTRGPPDREFIDRLVRALKLDEETRNELYEAREASLIQMRLHRDAPKDVFYMFNALRRQLDRLHPTQVELIQIALALGTELKSRQFSELPRLKRRSASEEEGGDMT